MPSLTMRKRFDGPLAVWMAIALILNSSLLIIARTVLLIRE
jgi:hypothetical protein